MFKSSIYSCAVAYVLLSCAVLFTVSRLIPSVASNSFVTLDRATYELSTPSGSYRLANKEFQMMEMLMMNPKNLISSERFMEKIWGYDSEAEINVVWVYISYLRKKLVALHANIQIKAMRNAGYTLEETT